MLQCDIVICAGMSSLALDIANFAASDVEAARFGNALEQAGFGGGHPHLPSAAKPLEEGGSALRIKMRRHLVEEQDRGLASALRHEFGMGEDQPEEQRFLLAGGRARSRH